MALITCPACGKQISENAISCPHCGEPIKAVKRGEVDSGTEVISVQGGNRLELSAKAEAAIRSITERLTREGKTIVNVQRTDPQPFTLGLTVWRMDITVVWNASLDSVKYQSYLYNQALNYQSSGQYSSAIGLYKRIQGYPHVDEQIKHCQEKEEEESKKRMAQWNAGAKARAEQAALEKNCGKDAREDTSWVYLPAGLFGLIGVPMFLTAATFYENNKGMFWAGVILTLIAISFLVFRALKIKAYDNKVADYRAAQYRAEKENEQKTTNDNIDIDRTKYICSLCGHVYDPEQEDNIEFKKLPDNWKCPVCGQGKNTYRPVQHSV